ncbi:hypothetical protein AKJ16_DCAP21266 [Drosera capensis]
MVMYKMLHSHWLHLWVQQQTEDQYMFCLALKLGLYSAYDVVRPISKFRSLKNTIWTSDCDFTGNRAFVGTDEGVTMVGLETRNTSKVFRSKSDVFALQLLQKDNRQIQHGAVKSYEGHVNSHTRIQRAVDPYERFVASGGEDGKVRKWSIKSGELLLKDKISNGSIPTACWDSGMPGALLDEREGHNNNKPRCSHPRQQSEDEWQGREGIKWFGMEKGLARMEF